MENMHPLDLVRLGLDEKVNIMMRDHRKLSGILHSFDQHLNMVLSNVKEEQILIEKTETKEVHKKIIRNFPLLFIRGDGVIYLTFPKTKTEEIL